MTTRPKDRNDILTVEEAETEIRRVVKDGYFLMHRRADILRECSIVIKRYVKKLRNPRLIAPVTRSLRLFAFAQLGTAEHIGNHALVTFLATREGRTDTNIYPISRVYRDPIVDKARNLGIPLREYHETYYRTRIKPVLDRMEKQYALDPDDVSGRNSLRNRAEMETRYKWHQDEIKELKTSGHRLVIASTHADCSERCRPWQGKVYSLDGSTGTTADGRKYIPLENATDIYYTTKAGKTYKNGLLGFNCRHYLVPYKKGFSFGRYTEKTEAKEYQITKEQRAMERKIRQEKVAAMMARGIDNQRYHALKAKAAHSTQEYTDFCRENDRPVYLSRVRID